MADNLAKANKLLDKYIAGGLLTERSEVSLGNGGSILVDMIESKSLGAAAHFLMDLKSLRIKVDISNPTRSSLPFWRKMHAMKLIPHNPDEYTVWEDVD